MAGTAIETQICGKIVKLGDYVRVRYTPGGRMEGETISGKVIELWSLKDDNHLQGRVESGWCFHDNDEILEHRSS